MSLIPFHKGKNNVSFWKLSELLTRLITISYTIIVNKENCASKYNSTGKKSTFVIMEKATPVAGKKIDKSRLINLEKGKIPPQAVELEEAVLGAMMIDKKGIDDVIDVLSSDAFYDQKHQEIYAAIYELFQNSEPIDLLTVSNLLKKNGKLEFVGGDFFFNSINSKSSLFGSY